MGRTTKEATATTPRKTRAATAKKTPTVAKASPAPSKRAPRKSSAAGQPISEEQRHRMICEAAYYRAEQRGFQGGSPEADWHAAVAEVDSILAGKASTQAH